MVVELWICKKVIHSLQLSGDVLALLADFCDLVFEALVQEEKDEIRLQIDKSIMP